MSLYFSGSPNAGRGFLCFFERRVLEALMKRTLPQKTRSMDSRRSGSETEEEGMDNDLHELFLDELADVYNAEQQLIKALPKMAKAAEGDEPREAFEAPLEETQTHVTRLEEAVEKLGESLKRKTCAAMKGLVE